MRIYTLSRLLCWTYSIFVSINLALSTNIYVWPLGKGIFNAEIKTNAAQGGLADISFEEGLTTLDYEAFGLKGTSASYIDLSVPANAALNGDTTFMFYVYLNSPADGVLFQYKSTDQGASNSWTGVEVTYNSNSIMFGFTGEAHSYYGGYDSITVGLPVEFAQLDTLRDVSYNARWFWTTNRYGPMTTAYLCWTTGFWTHIGIEKKLENNYIHFFINGVSYKVDGAPKDVPLKTPGTIRFGNSQPVNSADGHMQGRVTCVRLKAGTFTSGNVAHCSSSNWPSGTDLYTNTQVTVPCDSNCNSYKGYFQLKESGQRPLINVFQGIADTDGYSEIRCADMCLADTRCVSFLTWQVTGYCVLYDGDYTNYMETDKSGYRYYVRRDSCCMN